MAEHDEKSPQVTTPDVEEDLKAAAAQVEGDQNLDEAGLFLRQHNFTQAYLAELLQDAELNKKISRKVDLCLMPLLCITFLLQHVDKMSLSYGAVFDLFETTGITQNEYSWLASLLYFAYLISEWPSAYLAQYFPTARVLFVYIFSWGAILLITTASHNFAGLAVCRFLLGFFEAVITPAFMMIVGMWYLQDQQPARAGLFYCMTGTGATIGGILFYAVGYAKGFVVWKAIYLICGGLTVLWSFVVLAFLPSNIMTAKRFTLEEKALVIARVQTNRTGILTRKIKPAQIWEALMDPQVWILFLFTLLNETINGGLASFGKLIVKGITNGDSLKATAYGIPLSAFQIFWVFTGPFIASKFKNIRTIVMMAYLCPTIVGIGILWKVPRSNKAGSLMGYYIMGAFIASLVLALQLPASNVGGYTKRTTATAIVFLAYCAGNIIGPHAFLAREAPQYTTGVLVMLGCSIGQFILAGVLRALLIWRNKKRDVADAARGIDPSAATQDESDVLEDLTDFQNPRFRYVY